MSLRPRIYGLAVLFSLIWTSAFVAGRFAMTSLDSDTVLALRFALTALVLLPFLRGRAWRRREVLVDGVLLGLVGYALTLDLAFRAMNHIGSSMVVIITSTAPFVTLLMAAALGIERLNVVRMAGVVIGFGGVLLICVPRIHGHVDAAGPAMAAGATLAFSIATLWTRQRARHHDPIVLTAWQAIAAGLVMLPLARLGHLADVPAAGYAAIAWLALAVSIGAVLLWLHLIRETGASTASSFLLMNPVFGLVLGHLAFGEAIGWADLPGLVLVAAGIIMTTRVAAPPPRHHAGPEPWTPLPSR